MATTHGQPNQSRPDPVRLADRLVVGLIAFLATVAAFQGPVGGMTSWLIGVSAIVPLVMSVVGAVAAQTVLVPPRWVGAIVIAAAGLIGWELYFLVVTLANAIGHPSVMGVGADLVTAFGTWALMGFVFIPVFALLSVLPAAIVTAISCRLLHSFLPSR